MSIHSLHFDFDVDAGGKVEVHESINDLRARLGDIDKPFVGAHFELLAGILVDEGRSVDRVLLNFRGQRYGPDWFSAISFNRLDNLLRRFVDNLVIVRLEFDADALGYFGFFF